MNDNIDNLKADAINIMNALNDCSSNEAAITHTADALIRIHPGINRETAIVAASLAPRVIAIASRTRCSPAGGDGASDTALPATEGGMTPWRSRAAVEGLSGNRVEAIQEPPRPQPGKRSFYGV
jgi:hypothetical protein